jgi:hypothetical protein
MTLSRLRYLLVVKHGKRTIHLAYGSVEEMGRIWRDYSGRLNMHEVVRVHEYFHQRPESDPIASLYREEVLSWGLR